MTAGLGWVGFEYPNHRPMVAADRSLIATTGETPEFMQPHPRARVLAPIDTYGRGLFDLLDVIFYASFERGCLPSRFPKPGTEEKQFV